MAISKEERRTPVLECDGANKTFSFDFKVFFPTDVAVVLSDDHGETEALVESRRYIVQLNDNQDVTPGGRITFTTPPDSGSSLVIYSAVPYLQPMVLTNHGGFYPKVLNDAQDRGVILAQQNRELIKRAVTVSFTSSETPEEFKKRFFAAHSETVESKNRAETASSQAKESAQTAQQASTHVDEVKRAVDATAQEVQAVQATADALKEEINRGSQAVASANTNAERINSQAQAIKSELDTLKTTVHNDAQQAEQAKNETLAMKTSVEASASEASRHATEARSASESARQDKLTLQGAVTAVESYKAQALNASTEATRKAQESAQTAERLSGVLASVTATKESVDSKAQEVARAISQVETTASTVATTFEQVQTLKRDTDALKGRVDTAMSDVTRAVAEAKSAAAGALSGQVQADWTETNTGSKSFIRNKPTNLASTWDTVQGKPTQFPPASHTHQSADIEGWEIIMGGKANRRHTHTVYDITNLQKYGKVSQVEWADITGVPNFTTSWDSLQGKPDVLTPQNLNNSVRQLSGWTVTPGNGVTTASLFLRAGNASHFEIGTDNSRNELFIWNKKDNTNAFRIIGSSVTLYGNLNMNQRYLSNVHDPDSPQDGATKAYVDRGLNGKANTAHTHQASDIQGLPPAVDTSTLVTKTGNRGYLAGYEQVTFTKNDGGLGFQYDPTVPVYAPPRYGAGVPFVSVGEKPTSFDVTAGLLLTIDKNTPDTLTVIPAWESSCLTVVFLRSSETTSNELDKYYSATKLILIQGAELIQFKDDLESFRYWDGSDEQTLDLGNCLRIHKTNGDGGVVMFPDNQPLKMGDTERNLLMAVHIHGDMVFVSKVASW